MLVIAASMSASEGFGLSFRSAAAAMIIPDWQKPHCGTSSATHAFWRGCEPSDESPSIVTIFAPDATAETGMTQLRVEAPSICTVHAPHCATPQPYFVPVSLS